MNELKLENGKVIKYKNFLDEAEYTTLINFSVDAYINGLEGATDNLEINYYNPIKCEQVFYRILLSMCIENYEHNEYDEYFSNKVHLIIKDNVNNAKEAWDSVQKITREGLDIRIILVKFLNKILDVIDEKIPEKEDMAKLLDKLPKEWKKVFKDFKEITEDTKKED